MNLRLFCIDRIYRFPKKYVYVFEPHDLIKVVPNENSNKGRKEVLEGIPIDFTYTPKPITSKSILEDRNVISVNARYLFYNRKEQFDPLKKGDLVFRIKHTWKSGVGKNGGTTVTKPVKIVGENILEGKVHKLEQPPGGGTYTMHIKWTITRETH